MGLRERAFDGALGIVRSVCLRFVRERIREEASAATRRETDASCGATERKQEIGADIGLEVNGEIEPTAAPRSSPAEERRMRRAGRASRKPPGIERLVRVDRAHHGHERGIPAADDEVNRRPRRACPNRFDGAERHQQIADAFEPQEKNLRGLA